MIPLYDDIKSRRRPYINYFLIGACSVVWAIQFTRSPEVFEWQIRQYGMVPVKIIQGQNLWTLFSSMFMHGGWFHFLGNMLYLWIFGDNVEDTLGHFFYLFVYILSGLVGNLLQVLVAPFSRIPTIGASGAISGIMGAYFVFFPRARILTLVPFFFFIRLVYLPASLLLGFWILFQILYGCSSSPGTGGGVAYFVHIGGFVCGILIALLVRKKVRRPWYEIY
ncbi:MAG: rhomboid family intramembrane serine protease [candidate division WOR-3 bacterium]|jgi:membrane associated rhomboid family serine protease|nr:rhomboid family intramembrane serine protease [candidate division WOR-3 bacterium]MCR4423399.1 rhomboid family intramembrane serine protease [candidate division WOR-3 bacterium]MDH7518738.1 rhomboid family intramembrane serine protease [bacterium]